MLAKCSNRGLRRQKGSRKEAFNQQISIPPYLCRREIKCSVRRIGGPLEVRTNPLPPPGLAWIMQDLKLLSFNVQWFRDLGASFSSFGCFVLESWVLRFRVLGASFSRFGCFVLRSSFSKLTCLLYQIAFRNCTFSSAPQRPFLVSSGGKEKRKSAVYDGKGERERERERERQRERAFPVSVVHRALTITFYCTTKGCLCGEESVDTKSYPVCELSLNQ